MNLNASEANAFTAALTTAVMEGFDELASRLERNNGRLTVRDLMAIRAEIGRKTVRQMSR